MKTELHQLNTTSTGKAVLRFRADRKTRPADLITPISFYLRIRDMFPGSILLESKSDHSGNNSRSFIAIEPLVTAREENGTGVIYAFSAGQRRTVYSDPNRPFEVLNVLTEIISIPEEERNDVVLPGYLAYDAVRYFEPVSFCASGSGNVPEFYFSLFRYVLEFNPENHTVSVLTVTEEGHEFRFLPEELFTAVSGPVFTFRKSGEEKAYTSEEKFLGDVTKVRSHCRRGDVFQTVLSRKFSQSYTGDDFNVYRALRIVNPSPYLFYADFKNFKLIGSSPEAQIVAGNGMAEIHPIAGTYRKTGDKQQDSDMKQKLLSDVKENAEHRMLVDLARNDLSRMCSEVNVAQYMNVEEYSHVMHIVSKVKGKIRNGVDVTRQISAVFPAGTLTGAPKVRAMEIIESCEPVRRNWYGGCIGMIGLNGQLNLAIMIRTFKSSNGVLEYQAGAGIVIDSDPQSELNEINYKLGALRKALEIAQTL
jgi:anthranilate synthase component I